MGNIEYLSGNEIKALLNAVFDTRDRAILTLFLDTGIFLNELNELNISSIDWKKKILHIPGKHKREIPLNDEAYNALVDWSKERLDCKSEALFITLKGEINRLSARNIDRIIRKYADQAGINKKVNTQILRNSFAVNFMKTEPSIDKACYILGLASLRGIRRYVKAATEHVELPAETLMKVDNRPKFIQRLTKLIPKKPREAKVLKAPAKTGAGEVTIGRDSVLAEIRENIAKEISTILIGDLGVGKTHLLNVLAKEKNYLYIDSPTPIKQFLLKLCEKYCPDWTARLPDKSRSNTKAIVELLTNIWKGQNKKDVLIVDNLDNLKISDLEMFLGLFDNFTILAAAEETPDRLKQIWWKFRRLDLPPLSPEASKELIKYLTLGLTIADYELLETRIMTFANGLPLAMVEMVNQIRHLPVVRAADVRTLYHEAGVHYRDWTPFVIILWGIVTSSRFIALGVYNIEGYIVAVAGMALLTAGIRFLKMGR